MKRRCILDVVAEEALEMPLVEHDDVVEALAPDRADHPFDERILPGRSRGGANLRQAQGGDGAPAGDIEDGVPVMQRESRRHMPRERFAELLPRPRRRGMRRDVDVQDPLTIRARTTKTNNTRQVIVGTVKKSTATSAPTWF